MPRDPRSSILELQSSMSFRLMLRKAFSLVSLTLALAAQTAVGQQSELPKLPSALTEVESRSILKEHGTKPHVEAAIKVSEARLQNAVKLTEAGQAEDAVRELNVNVALLSYADAYTRQ